MPPKLHQLLIACAGALPLWLLLRRPWKRRPLAREIVLGAFVVFMAGLMALVWEGQWASPAVMLRRAVERMQTGRRINLEPLRTLRGQLRFIDPDDSWTQLLGNTLLFMPWGFCLPLLWRKMRRPLVLAGMCLLLTCCIEASQLFIERMTDVDDILLNFLGSMAGAGLWGIVRLRFPKLDAALAVK